MSLLPVFMIILPLLGAGVMLGLSPLSRARPFARYVALVAVGLTTILTLAFRWMDPVSVVLSLWQPSLLFGAAPVLQIDATMQPLALAMAVVACSAILVEISRMEEPRPRLAATLLALLATGFVALWAANILTIIISWALYDLLQATGRIAAGSSARMAIRGLVYGVLATVFLWGGAMLSDGGADSELWPLMTFNGAQLAFWTVAGVLRLCVYPFHLSAPDDLGAARSLGTLLFLEPVVGWGLWLRLALANGGSLPGGTWVTIIAAITFVLGSFLAWSCNTPRHILSWIGVGTTGAVLLAAGLAGASGAAVIVAGSLSWALGMATLFLKGGLSDGLQRETLWWSIPSVVGALTLLGVPLTLGFVTEAALIGGLTKGDLLGLGLVFFIGNLFLVPSLVRWLMSSSSFPVAPRRWLLVARGVGLGLPASLLIGASLYPPPFTGDILVPSLGALFVMPGLMGWLLWLASLAGGGVLAWQEKALRPRMELPLSAIYDLLRLEWLYSAVVGALGRGLGVLHAVDEVIGGAGALLWSWLLFLLLLLLVWGGS